MASLSAIIALLGQYGRAEVEALETTGHVRPRLEWYRGITISKEISGQTQYSSVVVRTCLSD
jgi:hypothetical protein